MDGRNVPIYLGARFGTPPSLHPCSQSLANAAPLHAWNCAKYRRQGREERRETPACPRRLMLWVMQT